jgi:hypothetical protein
VLILDQRRNLQAGPRGFAVCLISVQSPRCCLRAADSSSGDNWRCWTKTKSPPTAMCCVTCAVSPICLSIIAHPSLSLVTPHSASIFLPPSAIETSTDLYPNRLYKNRDRATQTGLLTSAVPCTTQWTAAGASNSATSTRYCQFCTWSHLLRLSSIS